MTTRTRLWGASVLFGAALLAYSCARAESPYLTTDAGGGAGGGGGSVCGDAVCGVGESAASCPSDCGGGGGGAGGGGGLPFEDCTNGIDDRANGLGGRADFFLSPP